MSTFWKIGSDGTANGAAPVVPADAELSPEVAESILNSLASTYLNDKDFAGTLGAAHHVVERLGQAADGSRGDRLER